MARIFLRLPVGIAGPKGPSRLECEGATVGAALEDCIQKDERLRPRIFRADGTLWVGVFLNGRNVRQAEGLSSPLADGDEIRLLPPIAGG